MIALIFLKLLRLIPGSPEYEVVNVVLGIVGVSLTIIVTAMEWMRSKFGSLEDSLKKLTETVQQQSTDMRLIEQKLTISKAV